LESNLIRLLEAVQARSSPRLNTLKGKFTFITERSDVMNDLKLTSQRIAVAQTRFGGSNG
jgi:hypothetical protein